jgi:hypothetical protein
MPGYKQAVGEEQRGLSQTSAEQPTDEERNSF